MISEVGVYKSTEDMEKPNPIPKGMEVIDVTDKNVEDGKGFTFKEHGMMKPAAVH